MPLDLSVVITTFNSAASLGDTIESLMKLDITESPYEIIVVDNASLDNSSRIAEGYSQVTLISCPSNLGLARANNIGAASASGNSILFLNPDTVILPGALQTLMEFQMNHPNAALLGPLMLDSGGTAHSTARTYPTLLDIVLRRTPLGKLPGSQKHLQKHLNPAPADEPSIVDWLVGAALWLTPAGRERVGLMSEKYFLYFEDVQWCMRAKETLMDVWFVPGAVIMHENRRESAGGSIKALWLHLKSMIRFFSEYPCAMIGKCHTTRTKD